MILLLISKNTSEPPPISSAQCACTSILTFTLRMHFYHTALARSPKMSAPGERRTRWWAEARGWRCVGQRVRVVPRKSLCPRTSPPTVRSGLRSCRSRILVGPALQLTLINEAGRSRPTGGGGAVRPWMQIHLLPNIMLLENTINNHKQP